MEGLCQSLVERDAFTDHWQGEVQRRDEVGGAWIDTQWKQAYTEIESGYGLA